MGGSRGTSAAPVRNEMRLTSFQKVQAAFSAVKHRRELKKVLIRRYWQQKKSVKIEVGGVTAIFDTSDFLSNIIFWGGEFPEGYEPSACGLLATLIKHSKVYADVGGNVGVFSILPAMMNQECNVFYFEMDRTIRPLLIRNMKLNKLDEARITIVNAAVGDDHGELEYLPHPYSFLAMLGEENIDAYDLKYRTPVIRLDEYFHGQAADPDLVKIDIDGAELLALRGMRRILQETKPDLLLEVHPAYLPSFGSSAADVCNLLLEFDYRFFSISDFRYAKTPRLTQIFDFNNLATPTGDMIFVTTGDRHRIVNGVLSPTS
jgi:FkbM family methyltransferase